MSAIFYIMGKSATGKDLVYRTIKQDYPELTPIVLYTTRPMRKKETQGVEYHFIDEAKLEEFDKAGKIIEKRTYQTVHGPWHYATVDDGTVDPADPDKFYVAIGTLEAYTRMRGYYGAEMMIPICNVLVIVAAVVLDSGLLSAGVFSQMRRISPRKICAMRESSCPRIRRNSKNRTETASTRRRPAKGRSLPPVLRRRAWRRPIR